MSKKVPRGRNGGRPPIGKEPTVRLSICLQPSTVEAIKNMTDKSVSRFIRELVENEVQD